MCHLFASGYYMESCCHSSHKSPFSGHRTQLLSRDGAHDSHMTPSGAPAPFLLSGGERSVVPGA